MLPCLAIYQGRIILLFIAVSLTTTVGVAAMIKICLSIQISLFFLDVVFFLLGVSGKTFTYFPLPSVKTVV